MIRWYKAADGQNPKCRHHHHTSNANGRGASKEVGIVCGYLRWRDDDNAWVVSVITADFVNDVETFDCESDRKLIHVSEKAVRGAKRLAGSLLLEIIAGRRATFRQRPRRKVRAADRAH